MSKPRRDKHYLADITEAIGRIISYTKDLTYEEFLNHTMVQDAVLRNLQVIGEATKKVSPSLCNANSDIPWREMAGMRDKIVHEYFGINYRIVWEVAHQDLPQVLPQLELILQQLVNGAIDLQRTQ